MTITTSIALAIAACNAGVAKADGGTTNPSARFTIYSGAMPATARAALGGATALVTIAMANPAFGAAADNPASLTAQSLANAIADTPAIADGTASFYRLFDRDNNVQWQGTVTEPNAGGDMEVSSINVVTGVNIVVQSFAMRQPY